MKHAFSLIELSIVLVILGLLTGGILTGQSLIRASELRSVSTEYTRYKTASYSFRDKYFALPGDMRNATSFWGAQTTCPGNAAAAQTPTCNGNANGMIEHETTLNGGQANERYTFWQHLANAGMIEGMYSGTSDDSSTSYSDAAATPGKNVPPSKLNRGVWTMLHLDSMTVSNLSFFEGSYGNLMILGAISPGTQFVFDPVLKPEEAWNIDTKLDDGMPGTGTMRAREDAATCHNQTASSSAARASVAQYALTLTSVGCLLIFTL